MTCVQNCFLLHEKLPPHFIKSLQQNPKVAHTGRCSAVLLHCTRANDTMAATFNNTQVSLNDSLFGCVCFSSIQCVAASFIIFCLVHVATVVLFLKCFMMQMFLCEILKGRYYAHFQLYILLLRLRLNERTRLTACLRNRH